MSKLDEPKCRNCANRYDLMQFDYSKGGCKHTKMDGFICMAFSDERKAIWMIGADDGCEGFIKSRGTAEHEQTVDIAIKALSAQPEITDGKAIAHLQESGWMQAHDKQMYEMGLREQLADDSDSYDALLPSAQQEIIRCKECVHWKKSNILPPRCEVFDWFSIKNDYCSFAERRSE